MGNVDDHRLRDQAERALDACRRLVPWARRRRADARRACRRHRLLGSGIHLRRLGGHLAADRHRPLVVHPCAVRLRCARRCARRGQRLHIPSLPRAAACGDTRHGSDRHRRGAGVDQGPGDRYRAAVPHPADIRHRHHVRDRHTAGRRRLGDRRSPARPRPAPHDRRPPAVRDGIKSGGRRAGAGAHSTGVGGEPSRRARSWRRCSGSCSPATPGPGTRPLATRTCSRGWPRSSSAAPRSGRAGTTGAP